MFGGIEVLLVRRRNHSDAPENLNPKPKPSSLKRRSLVLPVLFDLASRTTVAVTVKNADGNAPKATG